MKSIKVLTMLAMTILIGFGCAGGELQYGSAPEVLSDSNIPSTLTQDDVTQQAQEAMPEPTQTDQVDKKLQEKISCPTTNKKMDDGFREMRGVRCELLTSVDIETIFNNSLNTPQLFQTMTSRVSQRMMTDREYSKAQEEIDNITGALLSASSLLSVCKEASFATTEKEREVSREIVIEDIEEELVEERVSENRLTESLAVSAERKLAETTSSSTERETESQTSDTTRRIIDEMPILYILKAKTGFNEILNRPEYEGNEVADLIKSRFDGNYQDLGGGKAFIGKDDMIIFGNAALVAMQNEMAPPIEFNEEEWLNLVPKTNVIRQMIIEDEPAERIAERTSMKSSSSTTRETAVSTAERIVTSAGISLLKDDICKEDRTVLNRNTGAYEQNVSIEKYSPEKMEDLLNEMMLFERKTASESTMERTKVLSEERPVEEEREEVLIESDFEQQRSLVAPQEEVEVEEEIPTEILNIRK